VAATVAVVFALAAGSGASQRPAAGRSVDASGHNRAWRGSMAALTG
jgi:hypothetical protein